MSERINIVNGEFIEDVEKVDVGENQLDQGSSLRIRVHLDVNKPLRHTRKLMMEGSQYVSTWFCYVKLTDFCYTYGMLDHQELKCLKTIQLLKEGLASIRLYGSWLRAETSLYIKSAQAASGSFSWLRAEATLPHSLLV